MGIDREKGYYWIWQKAECENDPRYTEGWCIGEWTGSVWFVIGCRDEHPESDMRRVGERIIRGE